MVDSIVTATLTSYLQDKESTNTDDQLANLANAIMTAVTVVAWKQGAEKFLTETAPAYITRVFSAISSGLQKVSAFVKVSGRFLSQGATLSADYVRYLQEAARRATGSSAGSAGSAGFAPGTSS